MNTRARPDLRLIVARHWPAELERAFAVVYPSLTLREQLVVRAAVCLARLILLCLSSRVDPRPRMVVPFEQQPAATTTPLVKLDPWITRSGGLRVYAHRHVRALGLQCTDEDKRAVERLYW